MLPHQYMYPKVTPVPQSAPPAQPAPGTAAKPR
jgi:hypothetical protein